MQSSSWNSVSSFLGPTVDKQASIPQWWLRACNLSLLLQYTEPRPWLFLSIICFILCRKLAHIPKRTLGPRCSCRPAEKNGSRLSFCGVAACLWGFPKGSFPGHRARSSQEGQVTSLCMRNPEYAPVMRRVRPQRCLHWRSVCLVYFLFMNKNRDSCFYCQIRLRKVPLNTLMKGNRRVEISKVLPRPQNGVFGWSIAILHQVNHFITLMKNPAGNGPTDWRATLRWRINPRNCTVLLPISW